jgi:hypothetical protein
MTESEWMEWTSSKHMLEFVQGMTTKRKTRLFACACCRRFETSILDNRTKEFIGVVERFADGLLIPAELDRAYNAACDATKDCGDELSDTIESLIAVCGEYDYQEPMHGVTAEGTAHLLIYCSPIGIPAERKAQAELLRDIIGNPFRPVAIDSAWRTSTVTNLAQGIYEEGTFERLPILADALEDAGCSDAAILDHLRGPGPHVRGCWVVDLLLGKS